MLVNCNMMEAGSKIKLNCTSMKILFSAAMNFKMNNKTQWSPRTLLNTLGQTEL